MVANERVLFRRRFQNRVAMRFLCGHYLALSSPQRNGFVGLVQRGVSLTEIAQVGCVAFVCSRASCRWLKLKLGRPEREDRDGVTLCIRTFVFVFSGVQCIDAVSPSIQTMYVYTLYPIFVFNTSRSMTANRWNLKTLGLV